MASSKNPKRASAPSMPPTSPAKPTTSHGNSGLFMPLLVAVLALGASFAYVQHPDDVTQLAMSIKSHTSRVLASLAQSQTGEAAMSSCMKDASEHLTDVHPVKGFHVLCIEKTLLDTMQIVGFKDGMIGANRSAESAIDTMAFRQTIETLLEIPRPTDEHAVKYKQPYAFFTPDGERIDPPRLSALTGRVVFLFEGGQFIWPGVRIGYQRIIKDVYGKGDVMMETLSLIPLVFSVENFLKDEEIDLILELSLPHLQPSGVTLIDGHENRPATDWRTSTTYFLPSTSHPVVQDIDRRTADLVKVPTSHQEFVQVLRYEETQKYDHHTDYFPAHRHKNSPDLLERIDYGYKNRMITVFWYMSDVAKGGHTIFPRAGGAPKPTSMTDCTKGLKVAPKKRKVIVFYSMLPNGEGDPMSLHGGCPVEDGTKYSGNKWVWNKPRSEIP